MQITEDVRRYFDQFDAQTGTRLGDFHMAAIIEGLGRFPLVDDPTFTTARNQRTDAYIATSRGILHVSETSENIEINHYGWATVTQLDIVPLEAVHTGNQDQPEFTFRYVFVTSRANLELDSRAATFVKQARDLWLVSGNPNAY